MGAVMLTPILVQTNPITEFTLGGLRTRAQTLYAERSTVFFAPTEWNQWINDGIRDLAAKTLFYETEELATGQIGVRAYANPANCILIRFVDYGGARLTYRTTEQLQQEQGDGWRTASGPPEFWTDRGGSFILVPAPTAAATINVWQFAFPEALVYDTDACVVPQGYTLGIALFACRMAAIKDRSGDPEGRRVARFGDAYEAERQALAAMVTARKNPDRFYTQHLAEPVRG